ncbi:MAG TPA: DPP IV N-terminal domain-containing protein [Thermoanaerobaculia bacterium]|nr:DPP IV N-terminal domain-containing protein [Thermoanaerobaculia bacterium]
MIRKTLIAVLLFATTLTAQQVQTAPPRPTPRELTLENIFDPKRKVSFSGTPQFGFVWLDDHTFTWPRTDEKGDVVEQSVIDTQTGKTRTLFDAAKLQAAARKAGLSEEEAKRMTRQRNWDFSPNKRSVVLTAGDDLYLYTFDSDSMTRLTSTPGEEQEATFSPDGRLVAFVRNNNLYVVDLATQRERQLTTSGNDDMLNGVLDWVYSEEVYGRGHYRAYWWSPDSSHIVFMQLDEKPVKRFTIVDHIPTMQRIEEELYPKAGYPNPIAKLFTVAVNGAAPQEISTESYSGGDYLLVAVDWTPDSSNVVYQITNREQTWLDLDEAAVHGGMPKTLFRETTKAWVNPDLDPSMTWLKDGSFLWLSERSGFEHLYQYGADGVLKRQITNGPWEVRNLHGIDNNNDWIYFSGTERSALGTDVYRVHLDGSGLTRLSQADGEHRAIFNPSMTQYIDSWSDIQTPPQVSLMRNDGTRVRVIEANEVPALGDYGMSKPEFLEVRTRDGFTMNAMMIKPPGFDPSRKYPVYEYTYSGPHTQMVRNGWRGVQYLWWQLIAQHGAIVWVCDNRTASGKGAESAWPVYKHFGVLELRDLEDGLKWLESQPWVDSTRVILDGWSFGGFMTTYALTHSTMWSAGMAGGTVADWHDYDTIYTERYMLMPQNNPEGYHDSSPRFAAANLHGSLLLMHGTIDDNVHMQNTIQLIYELEKAGKPYRLAVYPKSRHGVVDPVLVQHLRMTQLNFLEDALGLRR